MKYLYILFAIYVSLLTVLPCGDGADVIGGTSRAAKLEKALTGDGHMGEDFCPPFCSCTCCSVQRDFISSAEKVVPVEQVTMTYGQYKMPAILDLALDIYQPPQIV